MAKYKLILDDFLEESQFSLVAIHCTLEDYRVAFLLNQALSLKLTRKEHDLDYDYGSAFYSIYEWYNNFEFVTWNMVTNKCRKESEALASSGSLFEDEQKSFKMHYLIPEANNVDYFLKVKSEGGNILLKEIIHKIQSIPQIITAYMVNANEYKSKNNLIFN